MKKLFVLIFVVFSNISFATTWWVSITNGDNIIFDGLSVLHPKRDITGVFATSTVIDGDIINIETGTYTDHPVIDKNVSIYGYRLGSAEEVIFDLSTGDMVFSMSGTTQFLNGTLTRFYFKGSTTTGIWIQSGHVLLSTAVFYIEPPFLFQGSLTDIFEVSKGLPTKYQLSQNYPNPFNPATTINYSIPSSQFVNLTIFDICGKEVECLVNEEKLPGNYEVKFNGGNLSSGIYFYRLKAGQFNKTKKFILLK